MLIIHLFSVSMMLSVRLARFYFNFMLAIQKIMCYTSKNSNKGDSFHDIFYAHVRHYLLRTH
jgi:hypothetical protein